MAQRLIRAARETVRTPTAGAGGASYTELTAGTIAAVATGSTTATVTQTITPSGGSSPITVVVYRHTASFTPPGTGTNVGTSFPVALSGLTAATTYYIRPLYTDAASRTAVGNEVSFTTSASDSNEPAGMTLIADRNWDTVAHADWAEESTSGCSIISDPTAPESPNNVLQITYPISFAGGTHPGCNHDRVFTSSNYGKVYAAWWVKWSADYEGHSSQTNKLFFFWRKDLVSTSHPSFFFSAEGTNYGTLTPTLRLQNVPDSRDELENNISACAITRGQWHKLEVYLEGGTAGGADGVARMWWDGILVADHTDIEWFDAEDTAHFCICELSPIWGGVGDTTSQEMEIWVDHTYVSGKA